MTVGLIELGDIHLELTPTVLQGRVVDQMGNAVADAQVMLENNLNADLPDTAPNWKSMVNFYDRTDDAGFFHIKGFATPGTYRAMTTHHEFERQGTDIVLGTEDIEIVLEKEAKIEGKVLVDSWLNPKDLQLLLRTANEYGGDSTQFLTLGEDGSFVIHPPGDNAGLATVRITLRNAGAPSLLRRQSGPCRCGNATDPGAHRPAWPSAPNHFERSW